MPKPRKRKKAPATLRAWYDSSARSWVWLADRTGLCVRTVKRVGAGYPATYPTALSISKVTRVPVARLLRGTVMQ